MTVTVDEQYMRRALQLARHGAGHVSPNPMVGAVIVHEGRIIGEGFHRRYGEGHAEVNAVASVKACDRPLLNESTIYVTLEPCSHYGKTPPCARLLIECGFKRAVIGVLDPFEKVSGRGVAMLRDAGIEVTVGVLEDACRALNKRFMTAHIMKRPYVLLKWAQSADGFLAACDDRRVTFSTPATMRLMHRERARVDAILVGARTATLDNPSLSTRFWPGNSPLRVLLDENLSVPHGVRLLSDGCSTVVYNAKRDGTDGETVYVKLDDCRDLSAMLSDLYSNRKVTSLMVEGGAAVLQQFIDAGLYDEIRVETSPLVLGDGLKVRTHHINKKEG